MELQKTKAGIVLLLKVAEFLVVGIVSIQNSLNRFSIGTELRAVCAFGVRGTSRGSTNMDARGISG